MEERKPRAAVAVANSKAMEKSRELVSNLQTALGTRDLIGRAMGVIMARHGYDTESAFDHLRSRSQAENRRMSLIAIQILSEFDGGL